MPSSLGRWGIDETTSQRLQRYKKIFFGQNREIVGSGSWVGGD